MLTFHLLETGSVPFFVIVSGNVIRLLDAGLAPHSSLAVCLSWKEMVLLLDSLSAVSPKLLVYRDSIYTFPDPWQAEPCPPYEVPEAVTLSASSQGKLWTMVWSPKDDEYTARDAVPGREAALLV